MTSSTGVIVCGARRHPCEGVFTIGRGQRCTIRLEAASSDPRHYVSRLHARIEGSTFTDLSEHGSYVEGVHVFGRSGALHDGDRIRIGDALLRFELPG